MSGDTTSGRWVGRVLATGLTAADVILRPVISEKSIDVSTLGDRDTKAGNKYTFAVHRDANKIQIKQAIEELYAKEKVTVPAREMARYLVEQLRPISQDLSCENELLNVLEIVEGGTGSQRQRRTYEESGDFLDVVAFLIEGTRPALAEEQS